MTDQEDKTSQKTAKVNNRINDDCEFNIELI